MKKVSIVVITGMSGSGKSVALRALEDAGYFCIDNLPLSLFPQLLELPERSYDFAKLALVMDARGPQFFSAFESERRKLLERGAVIRTIYLYADEEVILRRYSETRRIHPLHREGSLRFSIKREREKFESLREVADLSIDTSTLSFHQLRKKIQDAFGPAGESVPLHLTLMSFGYSYGVPVDANLVVDVRFLPNPYFVPDLKERDGRDDEVSDFVLDNPDARTLSRHLWDLISFLLPFYAKEGKHYLTLAIGCTGGVHRSVAMVEWLTGRLAGGNCRLSVTHRELERRG